MSLLRDPDAAPCRDRELNTAFSSRPRALGKLVASLLSLCSWLPFVLVRGVVEPHRGIARLFAFWARAAERAARFPFESSRFRGRDLRFAGQSIGYCFYILASIARDAHRLGRGAALSVYSLHPQILLTSMARRVVLLLLEPLLLFLHTVHRTQSDSRAKPSSSYQYFCSSAKREERPMRVSAAAFRIEVMGDGDGRSRSARLVGWDRGVGNASLLPDSASGRRRPRRRAPVLARCSAAAGRSAAAGLSPPRGHWLRESSSPHQPRSMVGVEWRPRAQFPRAPLGTRNEGKPRATAGLGGAAPATAQRRRRRRASAPGHRRRRSAPAATASARSRERRRRHVRDVDERDEVGPFAGQAELAGAARANQSSSKPVPGP